MNSTNGGPTGDYLNPKLPTWDGSWKSFPDYRFSVQLEVDGCKEDERALLAPRLVRNLTGRAWEACLDIDREKLRQPDGAEYLLDYLRGRRGKQEVDLLGDSLQQYFQSGDAVRREGESLNDYEQRHSVFIRDIRKAMVDIGCKDSVPEEIYGWFMINKHLRLDATDMAMIKAQTQSYKLTDVMQVMRKMWGGDSLTHRDHDRKKHGRMYLTTLEEHSEVDHHDMTADAIWMATDDDPEGDDLDDSQEWLDAATIAFAEQPDDEVVLANFQEAKKTFYQEARKALDKHRVSRGFYPATKGKGKGKESGKSSSASSGFQGRCMRCGKVGHKAMQCKQNVNGTSANGSNKSGDSGRVGFVYASGMRKEVRFQEDNHEEMAKEHTLVPSLAVLADETQTKAILDSGASESIVGAHTLQVLYDKLQQLGLDPEHHVQVNRQYRRSFIFGNNETSLALGLASLTVGIAGVQVTLPIHIVEGQTPLLLSSKWLEEHEAIIDFKTGLAQFAFTGKQIQLERASTNHLLLSLTEFSQPNVDSELSDKLSHCEACVTCPEPVH